MIVCQFTSWRRQKAWTMSKMSGRPDSRGTRRGRDMVASEPSLSLATNTYEVRGDAAAALVAYKGLFVESEPSLSQVYNQNLLSYLATGGRDSSFISGMEGWKQRWSKQAKDEGLPPRKQKCKEMTILFNDCLLDYVAGKVEKASTELLRVLKPMVIEKVVLQKELLNVFARMTFLFLDCVLIMSEASHCGLVRSDPDVPPESFTSWLEIQSFDDEAQLKFLLSLYKSRLDFAARDDDESRLVDSKVRGVKKELKLAMELFNHKLRTTGDTGSVGSSSDVHSEDNSHAAASGLSSIGSSHHNTPQESLVQAHNQSALSLKAHLEQLKGNTKKALVLCSEARLSHHDPVYESIDSNNLSIVYATSRKRHLALYAAAKAMRAPKGGTFRLDGTACPDSTIAILHNAGISALQGQNYASAYECLAQCVRNSSTFSQRPRCWLRMAEACIGIHAERKAKRSMANQENLFSTVQVNGEPKGIVIEEKGMCPAPDHLLSENLGSKEDIHQTKTHPLLRATYCLEITLRLLDGADDSDCLQAARCSLAFVCLEKENYQDALKFAKLILEGTSIAGSSNLRSRVRNKRLAAARLYGCEASCALGDTDSALRFLAGDRQDDSALDRLAVDLAGVTMESGRGGGTISEQAKARLRRAQQLVRTSASATSAQMNRLGAAKQLAMSAISLEDNLSVGDGGARSSARKALLYCMLCEGNREGTLAVLRSSR